jgi:hypothetical protein
MVNLAESQMAGGLTPSQTIMKLLTYTVLMFAAPLATYRAAQDYLLPAAYDRWGWDALKDSGSRAVFSGGGLFVQVECS